MIRTDADPTNVGIWIIYAIGVRLAQFWVREVMPLNFLRVTFGFPFLARILEIAHQLLFLRIHRNNRLLLILKCPRLLIDVVEL